MKCKISTQSYHADGSQFSSSVGVQERKPELSNEIMAFRDSLLSSTISDTLDVWELKGMSNQHLLS